jgi:CRP/FNR family transcriptional regulator
MIRTIAPNPNRALFGRCTACAVRSLSICGALDQADLAAFDRIARHVDLTPNEALFTAGQAATSVHNITAGVARLYKLLPDGRRQVIGFALPGDFLGTMPSDRYSFSAMRSTLFRYAASPRTPSRSLLNTVRISCCGSTNSRRAS